MPFPLTAASVHLCELARLSSRRGAVTAEEDKFKGVRRTEIFHECYSPWKRSDIE
jgi:hypothetical protein